MTPTDRLAHALPADPDNDGPIGIADSSDLRAVLGEHEQLKAGLTHHLDARGDPCQDRGVEGPCDVAMAFGVPDPDGGA